MQSRKEFVEYRWYKITGRSMEPEFSMGDEVLVKLVPAKSIQPGDIVTFVRDSMVITHRIVRTICREGQLSFEEKADVDVKIREIAAGDIIGKVAAIKREGRLIQVSDSDYRFRQKVLIKFALMASLLFRAGRFVKDRFDGETLSFINKILKPPALKVLNACNRLIANSLMTKDKSA